MQEIEMKFRVSNYDEMKDILIKNKCILTESIFQRDSVYVSDLTNTDSKEGSKWIRIRNENGKIELNLKRQSTKLSQSLEIEFEVLDEEKAVAFLDALDLKRWVVVEKERITSTFQNYNLCLDRVKNLGTFLEIEILTEEENNNDFYENEILEIAQVFGLSKEDRVMKHYDTMIQEKEEK